MTTTDRSERNAQKIRALVELLRSKPSLASHEAVLLVRLEHALCPSVA